MSQQNDIDAALLNFYASRAEVNYHFHPVPVLDLLYIETPKVASTPIKGILQKVQHKFDGELRRIEELEDDPRLCHNRKTSPLPKFFDFDQAARARYLTSGGIRRIGVVRDPYSRVLSAYLNKIAPRVRPIYDILLDRHSLPPETRLDFRQFLRLESGSPPVQMNPHWRPQHYLLCSPLIQFDKIGRFDEISTFIDALLISIPDELRPGAPPAARNASDANRHLSDYYDDETIEIVKDTYREDFLVYGFELTPSWKSEAGSSSL